MTSEVELVPRTIHANPTRGRYWCMCGVLIALVGIFVPTEIGDFSAGDIVLSLVFILIGGTVFLVNFRITRKRQPSITLTPEGIHYNSIFFDREFREWRQLGEFSVEVRPKGALLYLNDRFGFLRQYTIVAHDMTHRDPLVPPPPGYSGERDGKEIWISARRLPMGENTEALAAFADELNAWRDRFGTGQGSEPSDQ